MWIETDGGPVLGLHLGMAGRIVIDDDAAGDYWSDGGRSTCRSGIASRCASPTAAGWRCATSAASAARCWTRGWSAWAPTPRRSRATTFRARVGRGEGPLKARIMDQSVLAGVGNLLADEALWRAELDPRGPPAGSTTTSSTACAARSAPRRAARSSAAASTPATSSRTAARRRVPALRRRHGARDDRRAHDLVVPREQNGH